MSPDEIEIPSIIERVEARYGPDWREILRQRIEQLGAERHG